MTERSQSRRSDGADVSGSVYGVHVRGRLPAGFGAYLVPPTHPRPEQAPALEVSYRTVRELPEARELWSSESQGPDGTVRLALCRLPEGFGLRISGLGRGFFRCSRRAIRIEWSTGGENAPHAFYSHALPLWLETEGVPVLHGSAVSLGGRAVAFLGQSGMGKSTLCAELVRAGCGFLSDDGLALRRSASGDWACPPGPPLLKLWPSGLRKRLEMDPEALPRVLETLEKRRLPLPVEADVPGEGRPLAAVYLLQRRPDAETSVTISECPPREALARLIEHGIAVAPAAALGLSGRRLQRLADVVERVPVRVLRYPTGADSAARILDAIDPAGRTG